MSMPQFDPGQFAQEGQDRSQAQKQALMQVIAEHGQAGAQAYADSQAQVAAQGQQALQGASSRVKGSAVEGNGEFASGENSRMAAITNLYTQDAQHGQQALASDMGRMSASNGIYEDQIGKAMPLVAENIAGQFQAGQQRIDAENAKREQERQLQELAVQAAQAQLEGEKVRAAAAGANGADNRTPDQRKHDDLVNQGLEQQIAQGAVPDPKVSDAAAAQRLRAATLDASNQLGGPGTNGSAALAAILSGTSTQDAKKKFKTPAGHPLNWALIQQLANNVTNAKLS